MALICVSDGACTTWGETIPASVARGPGLPFLNTDANSLETCYEVSNIADIVAIAVSDLGGGIYDMVIEDPNQSGLISSPQGVLNNTAGALPDCLDGSDPTTLFVWSVNVTGSTVRNFVFHQSQVSFVTGGPLGTGASHTIRIDTNLPFNPSPYPYLTLVDLQDWVVEFPAIALADVTITKACCQTSDGTKVLITNTGPTTWDFRIEDPLQVNLVSDADNPAPNNVTGSIIDCLNSGDDAIVAIDFSVLGVSYSFGIPVSQVVGLPTFVNAGGADLVIQLDTSLPFTTAGVVNTLQADLLAASGLDGFMSVSSLRCDSVKPAELVTGDGTVTNPLKPSVVLHPDNTIECGPNGLRLSSSLIISPQGPTSSPLSNTPAVASCENWICELPNGDWYAPEHGMVVSRVEDLRSLGLAISPAFVLGSPNNHILNWTFTNTTGRPLVPRIVVRVQSRVNGTNPTIQTIAAAVNESWTGNSYVQSIAVNSNMYNPFGGTQIENEKQTTFVAGTTGGIYTPNLGGYIEIPHGGTVSYDFNVGQSGPLPLTGQWTRSVIVIEAALFTSA